MSAGILEHVNLTVKDPDATAALLCKLFGWQIRWKGDAKAGGTTIHVGADNSYLAIYSGAAGKPLETGYDNYSSVGGLNHIGVVVDDLDAVEARVKAAGLVPGSHADYEPGRRFYFDDPDGIEFEVVSYS